VLRHAKSNKLISTKAKVKVQCKHDYTGSISAQYSTEILF